MIGMGLNSSLLFSDPSTFASRVSSAHFCQKTQKSIEQRIHSDAMSSFTTEYSDKKKMASQPNLICSFLFLIQFMKTLPERRIVSKIHRSLKSLQHPDQIKKRVTHNLWPVVDPIKIGPRFRVQLRSHVRIVTHVFHSFSLSRSFFVAVMPPKKEI